MDTLAAIFLFFFNIFSPLSAAAQSIWYVGFWNSVFRQARSSTQNLLIDLYEMLFWAWKDERFTEALPHLFLLEWMPSQRDSIGTFFFPVDYGAVIQIR